MIDSKVVLVTGVNGFIGSHVSSYLNELGYEVYGIGREQITLAKGIKYYKIDLLLDNCEELLKEINPSFIIHCAGQADVNHSVKYPDSDFEVNVILTRKLLYEIVSSIPNTTFVFLSSAAVYGNPLSLPISESSSLNPISPYALHKVLIENICTYFSEQYGLSIKILRIFSVYGAGLSKQLFWDMGQKYSETGMLEMFGTGMESRDFIHINDLVNAILLIVLCKKEETIFNVANGTEVTIREAANYFARSLGEKNDIVSFNGKNRVGNPINWCADISRLKKTGYIQKITMEKGVKDYVEWLIGLNVIGGIPK